MWFLFGTFSPNYYRLRKVATIEKKEWDDDEEPWEDDKDAGVDCGRVGGSGRKERRRQCSRGTMLYKRRGETMILREEDRRTWEEDVRVHTQVKH